MTRFMKFFGHLVIGACVLSACGSETDADLDSVPVGVVGEALGACTGIAGAVGVSPTAGAPRISGIIANGTSVVNVFVEGESSFHSFSFGAGVVVTGGFGGLNSGLVITTITVGA